MRSYRPALVAALLAPLLAGCVTIVNVPISPAPTPAPAAAATCPTIALEEFTRGRAGDLVRLRVANPGPETITVDLADFRLLDTRGNTYRTGSDTTALAPGQDVPVTLLGRATEEGWLTVARWDRAPCAPVAVALPDPR